MLSRTITFPTDVSPTQYVLGFAFDESQRNVLLIHKRRPAWQAGLLNGIGGHVEIGETPYDAMEREFQEETTLYLGGNDVWREFGVLLGGDFEVFLFVAIGIPISEARSVTDEPVRIVPIDDIRPGFCIPNLNWLVPMALVSEPTEYVTYTYDAEVS